MPQTPSKFIPLDEIEKPNNTPTVATPQLPATGKFIPLDISGTAPKVNLGPEGEAQYQQETGSIFRPLGPALPLGLGAIGALAGPTGAAVGATTGQLMRSTLEKGAPLSPTEAVTDVVATAPLTYVGGKLLGPLESKLGSALVSALWGKGVQTAVNPSPEPQDFSSQMADLATDFGLGLGLNVIGSAAGNRIKAKGQAQKVPLGDAIGKIRDDIENSSPGLRTYDISEDYDNLAIRPAKTRTEYARAGQDAVRGNLGKSKGIENAAWSEFRNAHLKPNTEKLQKVTGYRDKITITPEDEAFKKRTGAYPKEPILEDVEIEGPITMMETQKLAKEVLPRVDDFMKGESFTRLPDNVKSRYVHIYDTLKNVAEPFEAYVGGKEVSVPLKSYETVKEIRTVINDAVSGKPQANFPQAQLKRVAEQLGKDIETSMMNFWKDGPNAMTALDRANRATELRKRTFNKEIDTRIYGKPDGKLDVRTEADPDAFFRQAYQSPERAKRLMTAMGADNHEHIKGDYIDNYLLPKAFGKGGTKFNPTAAIDELKNPNSSGREILNAGERNNLLRVLEAARATGEDVESHGLTFLKDHAVLNLGIAASRATTGSSMPARVIIGLKEYFQYVRGSKPVADYTQRLIKIRPDSAEAEASAKLLMKGLAGVPLSIQLNGESYQGTVGENGKIKFSEAQ
jgi:hypothetical protein